MSNQRYTRLVSVTVIGATLYFLVAAWASDPANASAKLSKGVEPTSAASRIEPGQSGEEKPAEQVYKNILVLKGMPASELNSVMSFMAGSLGVTCTHCHVNPWMSDAKPAKQAARKMIQMVMDLNHGNFGSDAKVTCYTCHRGQPHPVSVPVITSKLGTEANAAKPVEPMPSLDDILNKYAQAVGKPAIEKLKTRIMKGSQVDTNGMSAPSNMPLEIYMEAPNKLLVITTSSRQGVIYEGYNGASGWHKDSKAQREMSGDELKQIKLDADFYAVINIRQHYTDLTVKGKEMIGDVETYAVEGTNADGKREKLYFNSQTGLLIRKQVETKTVLGVLPEITDFEDYRDVSGVKEPFTIRSISPPFTSTRKFTEIQHNLPINNDRFNLPNAK